MELPREYTDISPMSAVAPVFITAPTARNGVTLLQRLLNSTGDIIVYGENLLLFDRMPESVFGSVKVAMVGEETTNSVRRRFLEGEKDAWTSNLMPDVKFLAQVTAAAFYDVVAVYEKCSRDYGFERWGIKNPMSNVGQVSRLAQLLPTARFVAIYRNPWDVVRSAKARKFVESPQDVAEYAHQWSECTKLLLHGSDDRLHVIRYEELTADPEPHIAALETFTGLAGMDRSIMERRINTFIGSTEQGRSPDGYIPPADLTDQESDLVARHGAAGIAAAGYERPDR